MPNPTTDESQKTLLKVVGFGLLGVGAVCFFDLWPMYQATKGQPSFSISIKGTALGWFILAFSIPAALPTSVTGLSWGKPTAETKERHARNAKLIFGVCAAVTVLLTGVTKAAKGIAQFLTQTDTMRINHSCEVQCMSPFRCRSRSGWKVRWRPKVTVPPASMCAISCGKSRRGRLDLASIPASLMPATAAHRAR
jgi:hypothetical protein